MNDDATTAKRRGRPPMHSDKLQSEIIAARFRVTKVMADAIYRQAILERKSVSEWMRDLVTAAVIFRSQKNTDPQRVM